ncbi:MAG: hypothetical protein ACRD4U_07695, partial [Candidatus Acidiferrales bacterium]
HARLRHREELNATATTDGGAPFDNAQDKQGPALPNRLDSQRGWCKLLREGYKNLRIPANTAG